MIKITKAEQIAILKECPGAMIVSSKHHYYLGGYETAAPAKVLYALRGYDPTKKPRPRQKSTRKDGRQPRRW